MKELDDFYLQLDEPNKSCLLALRDIILAQDKDITVAWKYKLPFFCYKEKMFCYLWIRPKTKHPYIGFVEGKHIEHPDLLAEKRSRIKILLFDPNEDLPIEIIETIIQKAIHLYKSGQIKIRK
ncbi:DUF1801 domain-containing protein [Emticicia sp. SJ17W-69]|uniref:DUF1801 domain-containing protein n=1 Tax=Emticicia sp. SJ17W-69 TaxID=3421657 RepID=UPI003EBA5ADD